MQEEERISLVSRDNWQNIHTQLLISILLFDYCEGSSPYGVVFIGYDCWEKSMPASFIYFIKISIYHIKNPN